MLKSGHRRNEVADLPDKVGVVHEVGEELNGVGGGGQVLLHVLELVLLDGLDDGLGERLRVLLVHNRLHIRSIYLQVKQFSLHLTNFYVSTLSLVPLKSLIIPLPTVVDLFD